MKVVAGHETRCARACFTNLLVKLNFPHDYPDLHMPSAGRWHASNADGEMLVGTKIIIVSSVWADRKSAAVHIDLQAVQAYGFFDGEAFHCLYCQNVPLDAGPPLLESTGAANISQKARGKTLVTYNPSTAIEVQQLNNCEQSLAVSTGDRIVLPTLFSTVFL